MARTSRRSRPVLSGLETRQLLTARAVHRLPAAQVEAAATGVHSFAYATPEGARVTVSVQGSGDLGGSTVDANGVLSLVFSGTNPASVISINVKGGTAPLGSVNNLNVLPSDTTGVGGQLLGALIAPKVDLIADGSINLTSGIGRLQLRSIGANTQIHLRELPETVQQVTYNPNTGLFAGGLSAVSIGPGGNVTGVTVGTSATNSSGKGNVPSGDLPVNPPKPLTPIAPPNYNEEGRVLSYSNDANGGSTLIGVSGQFVPTGNQVILDPLSGNPTVAPPPGVVVVVGTVNAGTPGQGTIGNGQVFGYDPTANALIRFDARTGAALQSIAVGGTPNTSAGVGLARNGRELVVLLSRGTTVQAFDATTGAAAGQFSTATLASTIGFVPGAIPTAFDGVAFLGTTTVLTASNAVGSPGLPAANDNSQSLGQAVPIDVAASLASGQAVAQGAPYGVTRDFQFTGGATGLPTNHSLYVIGQAHFDSTQPQNNQVGEVIINGLANGFATEFSRVVLPNPDPLTSSSSPNFNAGPPRIQINTTSTALGSIEQSLAYDSGVVNGTNAVSLLNPTTLARRSVVNLADANRIVGLSGSFHPELAGTALVDVQGNLQAFNATTVHGLALNDNGNLNLVKINNAFDSTIVGQPVSHLIFGRRVNVTVETPTRSVGDRQAVTVDPTLLPLGPLSLPS